MSQDTKIAGTATAAGARPVVGAKPRPATKMQGKDRDMGSALRSVYQQTVEEPVPDDLLDLLGKLG